MMESLRGATRNTMFDRWLTSIQAGDLAGLAGEAPAGGRQPSAELSDDEVQVRLGSVGAMVGSDALVAPASGVAARRPQCCDGRLGAACQGQGIRPFHICTVAILPQHGTPQ